MSRLFVIPLLFLMSVAMANDAPTHSKVVAKRGDGAYSLLRRYHLLDEASNITKFYEINGLAAGDALFEGKEYKLPVMIYRYDGTSIRSTIGVDDWEMAKRIQTYNEKLVAAGILSNHYTESRQLWVPMYVLLVDYSSATAPPRRKVIHQPLFGEAYERVEIVSNMLKGQVFYIISGHGGPDPGALSEVGGKTLCEDEYAYDVALRLARKLLEHGAVVEVIVQDPNDGIRDEQLLGCDKEELSMGVTRIPIRQLERLKQRVHEVNKRYVRHRNDGLTKHTVVCVHVDSRSPGRRQDVFFYYYEPSKRGKEVAENLQATFKAKYEKFRPGRGYSGTVSPRGLYVLRHTDPPAVYVELANIRNRGDLNRILPNSNRQALANWLFEGLTK